MCKNCETDTAAVAEPTTPGTVDAEERLHSEWKEYRAELSALGVGDVLAMVGASTLTDVRIPAADVAAILQAVGTAWEGKDKNSPNWGRRLSKELKKRFPQFKQLPEWGGVLSQIKNDITPQSVQIRFSPRVGNWDAGDWGESTSSCWWGERGECRRLLQEAGGYSLLIEDKEGDRGRCWIYPRTKGPGYLLFNAYGPLNLRDIARCLANTWGNGWNWDDCKIVNNGSYAGYFYVNSGSGCAVVPQGTNISDRYDLKIDTSDSERPEFSCCEC